MVPVFLVQETESSSAGSPPIAPWDNTLNRAMNALRKRISRVSRRQLVVFPAKAAPQNGRTTIALRERRKARGSRRRHNSRKKWRRFHAFSNNKLDRRSTT